MSRTKKFLIGFGIIVLAILLFSGGVFAQREGWLNFTGKESIEQSEKDVEEIMQILRATNQGKLTAEEAYEDLIKAIDEAIDDEDYGNGVPKLKERIEALNNKIAQLTTDLNAQKKLYDDEVKAHELTKSERDTLSDNLITMTSDRDRLVNELTAMTDERDTANEYVLHLEAELRTANEKVKSHSEKVTDAVEEARQIRDGTE